MEKYLFGYLRHDREVTGRHTVSRQRPGPQRLRVSELCVLSFLAEALDMVGERSSAGSGNQTSGVTIGNWICASPTAAAWQFHSLPLGYDKAMHSCHGNHF